MASILGTNNKSKLRSATMQTSIATNWIVVTLSLLILGSLVFLDMRLEYENRTQREQDRLSTQARVVASDITHELNTANQLLRHVREEYKLGRASFLTAENGRHLDTLVSTLPGIRTIGVVGAQGKVLISTNPEHIGRDFSERDFFRVAKVDADPDRLYMSPPFKGLSGIYLIGISKVIVNADGSFGGVVFASLEPAYFKTLMESVRYAPDMWNALVHDSGHIFLLLPERPGYENKKLAVPGTFFTRHMESGLQTSAMTGIAMATGEETLMVQQTVNPAALHLDHALIVAMSRNLASVYEPWWRELKVRIGLYFMVVFIAISALYGYQRRHQRFEQEAAAAAAALSQSEGNYRLIVENTNELIIKVDKEGYYTYVNPAFCAMYDAKPEDLLGRHYSQDVVEEDRQMVNEFFEKLFHPPHTVSFVHRENTAHGIRYLEWRGRAMLNTRGQVKELVGIARDVTDSREFMDRLQEQAQKDYLTGLANRRHFMDQGEIEMSRAKRYAKPLSLFMIDIDYFKKINDTYGHKMGDQVLQKLSTTMRELLRSVDIIGRIGGEEFAVLLPETGLHEACEVAERLRDSVARTNVVRDHGMPVSFTVSIGVSTLQEQDMNLDVLLNLADQALYHAKQSGRNQVRASE